MDWIPELLPCVQGQNTPGEPGDVGPFPECLGLTLKLPPPRPDSLVPVTGAALLLPVPVSVPLLRAPPVAATGTPRTPHITDLPSKT